MKKILLPTDFSENSWDAISYISQLFKNEKCTLYLLNTYTPVIYHVEYVLVSAAEFGMVDAVKESSIKQLDAFKIRIKNTFKNPKHTIKTISAFNTLIPEINEVVVEKGIDYVAMGTKGATGLQEVLFGSNTVHAFKNIKCPLIAIPSGFAFETPYEVLFPTDYEIDYQDFHINPLIKLLGEYSSRVNVLIASYGYELSDYQKENKKKLEIYLNKTTNLFHSVSNQTLQDAINNFQLKTRVNLLVMINNKHSFFENLFFKSTINQIGFHLNIPFLVIPAKTNKT